MLKRIYYANEYYLYESHPGMKQTCKAALIKNLRNRSVNPLQFWKKTCYVEKTSFVIMQKKFQGVLQIFDVISFTLT